MNTLVLYYSKTGNNRFIAESLAQDLNAPCEALRPRLNNTPLLLLGLSFGNRPLRTPINAQTRVILCSPIWMGQLLAPLKGFLKRQGKTLGQLHFVSCCGSGEQHKDGKFGYNRVFAQIKALMGERCHGCHPLSVELLFNGQATPSSDELLQARLNQDNFQGAVYQTYQGILAAVRG